MPEQARDKHGYPLCPVCEKVITPGTSVVAREGLMLHVDCLPKYRAGQRKPGARAEPRETDADEEPPAADATA